MRDSSGPDSQSPRYLISSICLFLNQFPSYFFLNKTAFTLVFKWRGGGGGEGGKRMGNLMPHLNGKELPLIFPLC